MGSAVTEYILPFAPAQTGLAPVIAAGWAGTVVIEMARVLVADEPQVLLALTLKVPAVALFANVIVTAFPVPVIVAPAPL